MNSASFRCHVFSSSYEQLLMYFLLTHSEPHTLTLSSGSFFLKTPHQLSVHKLPNPKKPSPFLGKKRKYSLMFYEKKKRVYPFRENVLHICVIRCSELFLVIFIKNIYIYIYKPSLLFCRLISQKCTQSHFGRGRERSRVPQRLII